jgi:hypothetical protein
MTPLIPIYSDESKKFFVDPALHKPYERQVSGDISVTTNFLKFGERFDLMDISSATEMFVTGIRDVTDTIDPAVTLEKILVSFGDLGTAIFDVRNQVFASMHFPQGASFDTVNLDFSTTKKFDNIDIIPNPPVGDTFRIKVTGHVNLRTGDTFLTAILEAMPAGVNIPRPSLEGYTLQANATNIARLATPLTA